jgi:hypothetical protein
MSRRHVIEPHANVRSVNTDRSPKRALREKPFMDTVKHSAANAVANQQMQSPRRMTNKPGQIVAAGLTK